MNVYIAGLRRSGTTILFDAFFQDSGFKLYYEPLNKASKIKGGGSMATSIDYNEEIRTQRINFIQKYYPDKKISDFNFGAGSNFTLESEQHSLPPFIKEYLSGLVHSYENTILKFVRATFIIDQLYEIAPDSYFIHIQKNPIRFATSHIFGIRDNRLSGLPLIKRKAARLIGRYSNRYEKMNPEDFFNIKSGFNHWSQESIANYYIKNVAKRPDLEKEPAYVKLLFVWKEFNERIIKDGQAFFKDRFKSIEHEEFCRNPVEKMREVYSHLNKEASPEVLKWVETHVKSPRPLYAAEDPRWQEALQKLNIDLKYLEKS